MIHGPFDGHKCTRKLAEIRVRFKSPINPEERLTAVYNRGEDGNWYYGRTLVSVAPVKDSLYLVIEGEQVKGIEYTDKNGQNRLGWRVWAAKDLL